ncbi:hypothetical protein Tco_1420590 [Tanacetum coccineum]
MRRFTTTLHQNGVFIQNPFKYVHGERPKTYYYAKPGTTLVRGITEIKSESNIADFITLVYQNGFKIDLYDEHHGYDVMAMVRDDNFPMPDSPLVEDHVSSNEEECVTIPEFVDVQVEGDDNVVIKSLSIDDHFLNKLVGNGNFIGTLDGPNPPLEGTYVKEADPKEDIIDMKYKMWYIRNDFRCLLVYCGRDIAIGRCASKRKLKKPFVMSSGPSDNEKTPSKGVRAWSVVRGTNSVAQGHDHEGWVGLEITWVWKTQTIGHGVSDDLDLDDGDGATIT